MKTFNLKSLAAVASVTFMVASVQAQSNMIVVAPVKDAKAINLYVDKKEPAPYKVAILSNNDTEVWTSEYLNSMSKSFVLDALPDGDYKVVVNNEDEYFEQHVSVEYDNVTVNGRSNTILCPNIGVAGTNILVEYPDNASKSMHVRISDAKGHELYNADVVQTDKRMIKYDLTSAGAGTYDLTFTIDGKSFNRNVRIKP